MFKTVRAVIDLHGRVRLLEAVQVDRERPALVTILDTDTDVAGDEAGETTVQSELALAAD